MSRLELWKAALAFWKSVEGDQAAEMTAKLEGWISEVEEESKREASIRGRHSGSLRGGKSQVLPQVECFVLVMRKF
jgi:hypothetical protein